MGKRYILALVLMIAVMIVWTLMFGKPKPFVPEQNDPEITKQTLPNDTPDVAEPGEKREDSIDSDPLITVQDSPDDPTVRVRTANYDIIFNEKLAIAKRWELVEKKTKWEATLSRQIRHY